MYFSKVLWITRDGVDSLSVYPTDPHLCFSFKTESWNALYLTFRNHPLWRGEPNPTKDASMHNQYDCHADFATQLGKTPWNLEPSRPDRGYAGFVVNLCN